MTKAIPLSRPALSAIAAFLAISAPQAFAQAAPAEVPAMVSPVAVPPSAPEPAPAPVAAPQTAPTPQVAQTPAPKPVIRVPLDLPAEPAEPVAKTAERPAAAAKAAPARTERRAADARRAQPAPIAAPNRAPAAATLAAGEAAPVVPPAMTPAEPAAIPAPAPVEAAPARASATGDAFPWEIAGGAAALLLVGGAGLAFARRRRTEGRADHPAMSLEEMAAAEAVPYHAPQATPTATPPAMRSTPSFAAAPHGSMGRHEAMALTGPTPDNPFGTLKKRLQRARFLDRQERVQYEEALAGQKDMQRKPIGAWEIAQRDIPAPAQQEVRRPERTAARPGELRPGLIRH